MLRGHAVRRRARVSIRRPAAPAGVILPRRRVRLSRPCDSVLRSARRRPSGPSRAGPRRMRTLFCLALFRAHPGGIGVPFRSFDVASPEVWFLIPEGLTPRPRSSVALPPGNARVLKRYVQVEGARLVRGSSCAEATMGSITPRVDVRSNLDYICVLAC